MSLIVPLLALSAALNLVVLAWRGEANWKVFSEIQVTYVACMIAFAVGVATVLSIATLPRVRNIATRKPPLARFDIVAELVKALSLGLVLAMLPGLLQSSVSAFRDAEARARWNLSRGRGGDACHRRFARRLRRSPSGSRRTDALWGQPGCRRYCL